MTGVELPLEDDGNSITKTDFKNNLREEVIMCPNSSCRDWDG